MTKQIAWEIIPADASHGIPGASVVEIGFVGLYTEPLYSSEPNGPAAWGVETPDFDGGAILLRVGIAPSAERARTAAEAAAREVAAAVASLHEAAETSSARH